MSMTTPADLTPVLTALLSINETIKKINPPILAEIHSSIITLQMINKTGFNTLNTSIKALLSINETIKSINPPILAELCTLQMFSSIISFKLDTIITKLDALIKLTTPSWFDHILKGITLLGGLATILPNTAKLIGDSIQKSMSWMGKIFGKGGNMPKAGGGNVPKSIGGGSIVDKIKGLYSSVLSSATTTLSKIKLPSMPNLNFASLVKISVFGVVSTGILTLADKLNLIPNALRPIIPLLHDIIFYSSLIATAGVITVAAPLALLGSSVVVGLGLSIKYSKELQQVWANFSPNNPATGLHSFTQGIESASPPIPNKYPINTYSASNSVLVPKSSNILQNLRDSITPPTPSINLSRFTNPTPQTYTAQASAPTSNSTTNVYNIENVNIDDGIISDLESLLNHIKYHSLNSSYIK